MSLSERQRQFEAASKADQLVTERTKFHRLFGVSNSAKVIGRGLQIGVVNLANVAGDVDRYCAFPSRAIRLNVEGINYKNLETYFKRRLLVRKTGVGLKASITTEHCMTNQVVFHYSDSDRNATPEFYLSYVLGVFSSRVMFAYHLRTNGENEWRSHPYLTQKIINRLPIPLPIEGQASWKQARAIAEEVDNVGLDGHISEARDQRIEGLVAGLFGLTGADMPWVHNVISSAQELEPMRTLQRSCGYRKQARPS